ncbi:MAG: ACP phosphodiesterase [Bergeyella sp.]
MNYLAHSFLAFSDGQIVGQFLEDVIRNSERFSFPEEMQKGIRLHREVDTFTDSHAAISEAKKIFSPLVRLYSGAFVDVAMDYFLANDVQIFTSESLKNHSQKVYRVLNENAEYFPENFQKMLFYMEKDDWLYNYRNDWGIEFSMKNVLRKAKYLDENIPVFECFLEHKKELQDCYDVFFPELLGFVKSF